jgi:hypothetical protein
MIAREQRHEALAEWLQLKQDESASHCRCCRRRREQALDTPAGRARAAAGQVKKRSFWAIYIQKRWFYQDRLGTHIGKTPKRVVFPHQDVGAEEQVATTKKMQLTGPLGKLEEVDWPRPGAKHATFWAIYI